MTEDRVRKAIFEKMRISRRDLYESMQAIYENSSAPEDWQSGCLAVVRSHIGDCAVAYVDHKAGAAMFWLEMKELAWHLADHGRSGFDQEALRPIARLVLEWFRGASENPKTGTHLTVTTSLLFRSGSIPEDLFRTKPYTDEELRRYRQSNPIVNQIAVDRV